MKLLSREEVRRMDKNVIGDSLSEEQLIDLVGKSLSSWFESRIENSDKILVLVGPGNNGKDGEKLGQHLSTCAPHLKIDLLYWNELQQAQTLDLKSYHWIVDALFGVGLDRPLPHDLQNLVATINDLNSQRVAIDIPSGLDCNTGEALGITFKAHHTLTIAAPKRGLYLLPGRDFCGEIHIIEVEPLQKELAHINSTFETLPNANFQKLKPKPSAHKYNRGVVAIAQSLDFPGAALLCAYSAQASGAGYVKVICPKSLLTLNQVEHPSLVFIAYSDKTELCQILANEKYDALVIGAGWKEGLSQIPFTPKPKSHCIFDGGFLNSSLLESVVFRKFPGLIVTPHSGELSRICDKTDLPKVELVSRLQEAIEGVVVAKGYDTLVAQKNHPTLLTHWNSPSLAVAGSGDILAGLIASFSAQTNSGWEGAKMAVDAHRRLAIKQATSISPLSLISKIEKLLNQGS